MASTTAPSGLSITRNNKVFTLSWKQGMTYNDQRCCYQINGKGKDIYVTVYAGTTSVNITIDLDKYFPKKSTKLRKIRFWVRGHTYSYGWSGWTYKDYVISEPSAPKLKATHSDNPENQTVFEWSMPWGSSKKNSSNKIFTNYKWWTVLKKNSNVAPDKVKGWSESGESKLRVDSGSKTIKETTVFSGDDYSYTRYFKIQARGPNGRSKVVYAKHVYAIPNAPQNVKAVATPLKGHAGYTVSVSWTARPTLARPIDSLSVEYAIDTPVTRYTDSEDGVRRTTVTAPIISSWTTAGTVKDTKDKNGDVDGLSFVISNKIDDDKCIFVRVVAKHDNKISPSTTTFVEDGFGRLPSLGSFSAEVTGDIATVTVSNTSTMSASFVGIYHRTSEDPAPQLVGISPAGNTAPVNIKLPATTAHRSFGVRAYIADYTPIIPSESDVTKYAITNIVTRSSKIEWDDSAVPDPPDNITLTSPRNGVVRLTWDWTWTDANGVEISWADHDDAWESTDAPQVYNLENSRASAWNVAGLETGTWYFRIRLFKKNGEATIYGTYSAINTIKISQSPATPVLTLSESVVPPDGNVTCYWAFTATDGDEQAQAEIREAVMDPSGVPTSYTDLGIKANNEQYKSFSVADVGWTAGSTHYLAVKIVTVSGEESENWSIPRPVTVIEPLTAEITSTSLESVGEDLYLKALPLSVSATGSDESSPMTYVLERAEDYHLDRPDESEATGFHGEVVALIDQQPNNVYSLSEDTTVDTAKQYYTRSDEEPYVYTEVDILDPESTNPHDSNYYEITGFNFDSIIELEDLINPLDDGAKYNLVAVAQDIYGQKTETSIEFMVDWSHQAVKPSAIIETDNDRMVTMITPKMPSSGYMEGDVCDIYRLSVDRPELIVQGAAFETKYVDPYPTLGKFGGHRIVYRTINGDYITHDNEFAWVDYTFEDGNYINRFATVVDFGDDQLVLPYDLSLSNKWSKDFNVTKYLGGSIEGDWNPAVERSGSIKTRVAVEHDPDLISSLRKLANYAGICHVRTPDGSSFAANVDVTEDREEKMINMVSSFSLEITKVDSEGFDGIAYDKWIVNN